MENEAFFVFENFIANWRGSYFTQMVLYEILPVILFLCFFLVAYSYCIIYL